MPAFAQEFDRRFRDARQRVSLEASRKKQNGKAPTKAEAARFTSDISLDDFQAYMPMHKYIFTPTGELWPASSIDSRLPRQALLKSDGTLLLDKDDGRPKTINASRWLDRHKPVEQMTWAPGLPMLIRNRLISDGGWIERDCVTCFNLYRPPSIELGDPAKADLWLEHVHKIYTDRTGHILKWLGHRVQRPADKVNHALVLGGKQGIGKDTLLEPVKRATGKSAGEDATADAPQSGSSGGLTRNLRVMTSPWHRLRACLPLTWRIRRSVDGWLHVARKSRHRMNGHRTRPLTWVWEGTSAYELVDT